MGVVVDTEIVIAVCCDKAEEEDDTFGVFVYLATIEAGMSIAW